MYQKLLFLIASLFIGSLMSFAKDDNKFWIKTENGEIRFKIIENPQSKKYFENVVEIDKVKHLTGDFVIPTSVSNGGIEYFVEGIGRDACSFEDLSSLRIPASVWYILDRAFCDSGIRSIVFEEDSIYNYLYIGSGAFEDCKFSRLKLPNKNIVLNGKSFDDCNNLTHVILSDHLRYTGKPFNKCENIFSVQRHLKNPARFGDMFEDKCPWKKYELPKIINMSHEEFVDYMNKNESPNNVNKQISKTSSRNNTSTKSEIKTGSTNLSSIDTNIPKGEVNGDKTFVLIIANENYKREGIVPFAKNDGKIFAEYVKNTLGVPEKNIQIFNDASLNDMKFGINKLGQICKAYRGAASVIVYYAGHGVSNDKTREASLLPTDGYGSDSSTGYPLKSLYATLATLPAQKTMVFIDACFSGAQRADGMMESNARGIMIKPKRSIVGGKLVVLSATSEDQRAYPYTNEGHGLFTYFLLKKIRESKGNVTLGELADYVIQNVEQVSVVENDKIQSPTVSASPALPNWKKINL